ncbi:MAG: Ig-like domain-containing protein, partial [Muribaculaceae bacterium]|nr:Ig-like domain-containing protein [Muribaculaceae bacterium]
MTVNGATGISVNKSEVVLLPQMTQNLYVSLTPSGASYSMVSWSSSNTSVAKITSTNSSGIATITALAPGTAKIYAKTTDGSNLTATCQVTVVPQWCFLQADTIHYVRGTGNTVVELPIELVNYKTLSGLQFDMSLGGNMSFNLRNGVPDIWLDDNRKARNHTVAVERQSEGSEHYRVLVSSPTSQSLKGNDGVLLHANMQINKYGSAGLFPIGYSNITMAAPDETQYHQDPWQSYLSYEYIVGDANADTQVNVGDFGVTANKILNREVNSLYFDDAANVNQDYVVNVADLVGIANIALGIRPKEIRRSPAMHDAQSIMHDPTSLHASTDGNRIAIELDNEVAIAGLQMDIVLPQGVTVAQAQLQGRATGHDLQVATLPDGRVRLLVAAFSDRDIAAGDDTIMTLTLNGDIDGMATIGGTAAERSLISHELDEVCVPMGTTGID